MMAGLGLVSLGVMSRRKTAQNGVVAFRVAEHARGQVLQ
jgi:hypothetical protein